ncbi:protein phosphatase 1 regulatory subunit 21-like isoform X3 [Dermacentor variabilis]|uniref:protein phosphatase 1 regulatory subunit 21-like isoform X3 n=1 Tax=Dermacentor variabilis TaxID=34621 RepID=UPI003F5BD2B7
MDESASPEGGLPAKYQKLAYEYSKLRAQAQVLKKAVADEQVKNAELKDCLKDKDQGMRKLLQEVESLNFCNQQLTKRVGFLQEELEDRSKKNKQKKHHVAATASPMHQGIIDAELQSRIEENEKLHLQVSAAELEHKQTVQNLETELEEVRQVLASHKDQLSDAVGKREEQISRLTQERAKLELKLKSCEKELKEVSMKNELSESKLAEVTEILGSRLEEANTIVEQNVHFRDVGDGRAPGLDVPVTRQAHENGVRALLWQLAELVPEVSQALSTLHTYAEQRVRLLLAGTICGLQPQQAQGPLQLFAQHLHVNVAYLQPIEEAYQAYFDTVCQQELYILDGGPVILPLSAALSRYVAYLNKLLPYVALSLRAGTSSPTSDTKCHELRAKLGHVVNRVVVKFDKMSRYLLLLSAKGCEPGSKMCHCTGFMSVVGKLVSITKCLWEDFEDVKRQLSSLMLLEHELPTVSSEARTTDDCLVSSLASVANSCKKLSRALESHGKVLLSREAYQCRGLIRNRPLCTSHLGPHVALLRQRGTAYLRTCQLLESLKNKVRKLEEEKEHWMLEWQLLQAKYERQAKDMLPVSGQLLNKGEGDGHDGEVIVEHFKARIKEMIWQNQLADSKAVYYYSECQALQKRLHLAEQHKVELENQLQDTQLTLQQLRDEMRSTVRSYEDQLSTMSEHLASMNEKLTQQKDEIDALRHSSSLTKFGKKLKPK